MWVAERGEGQIACVISGKGWVSRPLQRPPRALFSAGLFFFGRGRVGLAD